MPIIQAKHSCPVTQVEGFPKDAKRSCEGSIHMSPGATRSVTADELAHMKSDALVGQHINILVSDESALATEPAEGRPVDADQPAGQPSAADKQTATQRAGKPRPGTPATGDK